MALAGYVAAFETAFTFDAEGWLVEDHRAWRRVYTFWRRYETTIILMSGAYNKPKPEDVTMEVVYRLSRKAARQAHALLARQARRAQARQTRALLARQTRRALS